MKALLSAVFLLPVMALVFWSGWYLRGYFDALDDTYHGLSFTYEGAKGPVTGRADSLRFDWRTGRLAAEGVTLAQSGAPAVMRVSNLDVMAPLPWTSGEAYVVKAAGGFLEVVRYSDGSWSFQDLAPAPKEPSEPVPIEVSASDVRIVFHDRLVPKPTTWSLAAHALRVGILGDDGAVSFRGQIDGIGRVSTQLDVVNAGLTFAQVYGESLNLLPVKRYLGQWESLQDSPALAWSADTGVFSGKFSAQSSPAGDWIVRGQGEAAATGLVAQGRRLGNVRYSGSFTESGAGGRIVASGQGFNVDGVGVVAFGDTLAGRIEGTASVGSASAIESLMDASLPGDLSFAGAHFDGAVALGPSPAFSGKLTADRLAHDGYNVSGLVARVASDGKVLRVLDGRGRAFGSDLRANLAIGLTENPEIIGSIDAPAVHLAMLPGVPTDLILGGQARVKVLVSGRASNLTAAVQATGSTTVALKFEDQSVPHDMDFAIAGDYRKGIFKVHALDAGGKLGGLRGSGEIDVDRGVMDFNVFASGLDLSALPGAGVSGTGYGELHVQGTPGDPTVDGFVEVYGGKIDDYVLPFASGRVAYRNHVLAADEMVARLGVSVLEGRVAVDMRPDGWKVDGKGKVSDLMLDDFTGGRVSGLASGSWSLAGTLDDPLAEVVMSAPTIVADRVELRDLTGSARWKDDALTLNAFSATVGSGKLTAEGSWARTGESSLRAHLENASTWALRPYLEDVARLGGRISGDAEVRFLDGEILSGKGSLEGRELSINREPIGGATISAEADSKEIQFSGGLGTIDSNYVIENGVYDFEKDTVKFDYYALGGDVETILRVVASLAKDAPVEQQQLMRQIKGVLTLEGSLEATKLDTGWRVTGGHSDATLSNIVFEDQPAGNAYVIASKEGDRFLLKTAEWVGPQAALRLNPGENYIDDSGNLSLSGDIYNIDLNWFKTLRPELADVSGKADASFIAAGKVDKPEIEVTVATNGLKYRDVAVDLTAGPFSIRDGWITAGDPAATDPNDPGAGFVRVKDLEARLVGVRIPFKYPATIPKDEPVAALLVVPDRDIRDVSEFLGIDPSQSEGQVRGGRLEVGGALNDLQTRGAISLEAPRIKFTAADTPLVNARVAAELNGSTVQVTASADSADGGDARAELALAFDGMTIQQGSHIYATGLKFSQRFGTDSRVRGILDADLQLSGGLFEPLIRGTVVATETTMRVAGEFPAAENQGPLPVNPVFDVDLELRNGQVGNGPLDAQASGSGRLQGPLGELDAKMNFTVESGELRLPSTRIRLERGGVAAFDYSKNFEGVSEASLNVQLNATTRVTADGGLGPQRYEVAMEIRGDLLSDEELDIRATSDPPDLSQAQIMAILGQKDIFENVAAVGFGNFEDQVKNVLSSVAAPLLLGEVTRQIERALGLDYFSVDFAAGGIGGVTVAKGLGNGFTIEYRRLLEQYVLDGQSLDEVKLTYRLPSSNPILGRFTVGVALDGEGLFKATLSYTRRF